MLPKRRSCVYIASVGSTKKITDAMKLVAAAKVKRRKMPSSTRVRSLNNSSKSCLPSTTSCKASVEMTPLMAPSNSQNVLDHVVHR